MRVRRADGDERQEWVGRSQRFESATHSEPSGHQGGVLFVPSIEIACVGLERGRTPPQTSFDIVYEVGLTSHRVPSRFQRDFDATAGTMYHLGNPGQNTARSGAYTAYELLSDKCLDQEPIIFLEFGQSHVQSLKELLPWLLESSPAGR
jgi:hypothetical protein